MKYEEVVVQEAEVPQASTRVFQHLVKTYASEINKLNSVWHEFAEDDRILIHADPVPYASSVRKRRALRVGEARG